MAVASKKEHEVGFARKQLEKHGWCEGKSKNRNSNETIVLAKIPMAFKDSPAE